MALHPNPVSLTRSPNGAYSGFVDNTAAKAPAPWSLGLVYAPSTGQHLLPTRWIVTAVEEGGETVASLVLLPGSTTEDQLLQSGAQLVLGILYSNGIPAYLTVQSAT